jgi:hypothetical protein
MVLATNKTKTPHMAITQVSVEECERDYCSGHQVKKVLSLYYTLQGTEDIHSPKRVCAGLLPVL